MLGLNNLSIAHVNPSFIHGLYIPLMAQENEGDDGEEIEIRDPIMQALDAERGRREMKGAEFLRFLLPGRDFAGQNWKNWKRRGFPRQHLERVAERLRWPMNKLFGHPDEGILLDQWEIDALSDLHALLPEDRTRYIGHIQADADKARRTIAANGGVPPPRGVLPPAGPREAKPVPSEKGLPKATTAGSTTMSGRAGGNHRKRGGE